ncbi:GNAT family N-acetyltransferase [Sphingobacteriaceae bacterium]|nr:GNAT family N-acetyltransferase [Sphingobacteriaceae bacterium]
MLILATSQIYTFLMQDVKLIPAEPKDIALIAALAELTWNQHYPAIISQQQINYMLEKMYSFESLEEQMTQKGHMFFLIAAANETIGFISVHRENENDWFLNKFYIDQNKAGKGIGAVVFEAVKKTINPAKITLTVNRQNFKSLNFYFKMGFKIERVADFDIGNGYVMNDFVMTWQKEKH